MSAASFHRHRAREAFEAACVLREAEQSAWAVVPLFYSAMHAMHARFDEDELPEDMRHPDQHKSRREGGRILVWGTVDVVRSQYDGTVSRAYTSLFLAGWATRYSSPLVGDGARLWADYETLVSRTS